MVILNLKYKLWGKKRVQLVLWCYSIYIKYNLRKLLCRSLHFKLAFRTWKLLNWTNNACCNFSEHFFRREFCPVPLYFCILWLTQCVDIQNRNLQGQTLKKVPIGTCMVYTNRNLQAVYGCILTLVMILHL